MEANHEAMADVYCSCGNPGYVFVSEIPWFCSEICRLTSRIKEFADILVQAIPALDERFLHDLSLSVLQKTLVDFRILLSYALPYDHPLLLRVTEVVHRR